MKHIAYAGFFLTAFLAACQPENTPPVAKVFSVPGVGDSTTVFMLEGSGSTDRESSVFVLRYRWDVNNDGTWDTEYSTRTSCATRFGQPGYQKYRLEVADEDGGTALAIDSVFILSSKQYPDTMTDPRDGKRYPVIRLGETWWMAENLCYGTPIDWQTPPTNNGLVEFLYFNSSPGHQEYDYGALYTWEEANIYSNGRRTGDICPPGWRIPSPEEWSALFKKYAQPFDVLYYFGPSSIENLGLEMNGYYKYGNPDHPLAGEFLLDQLGVHYWTDHFTGNDSTRYYTAVEFTRDSWSLCTSLNKPAWILHPFFPFIIGYNTPEACYVRCIKE